MPSASNGAESMSCPIATTMRSQATRRSGAAAARGAGLPPPGLADDLGLHDEPGDAAVRIAFDADRGVELQISHPSAWAPAISASCAVMSQMRPAVRHHDLACAEAHRGAGDVHGDVAAAHDHDALAGEIGQLAVADGAQHAHRALDSPRVLPGEPEFLVEMGPDGEVDGIVLVAQGAQPVAVHGGVELDVDAAIQDPLDLGIELGARQTVVGNAVAEHAAQAGALLVDGDRMAHERKVVRTRDAGGPAAHDGDALARGVGDLGTVVALHVLARVALEGEDVERVVHDTAAAVHLAWMLADEAAHDGHRVVLADQADGVGEAPRLDERDVAGDVDVRRAAGDARHAVVLPEAA